MHVALTYNQKKEISSIQQTVDDLGDPPSTLKTEIDRIAQQRNIPQHNNDAYAEWDTEETISAVKFAIEEQHRVTMIEADEDAYEKIRKTKPDIVFNIAEGINGITREAQIPAMLEFLKTPYTGSDPMTLAITLDKARTKEILAYHDIPTPKFIVITERGQTITKKMKFPMIVKPLHEGSSKGIFNASVVKNENELQEQVLFVLLKYKQPALVEEFIEGREFTVALLGNGNDIKVLPIVEINFDSLPENVNKIYSYEAKWIWDQVDHPIDVHECPARITSEQEKTISKICKKTYNILRCRDWSRIDLRLDANGNPNILEVNPLPGILPNPNEHSCFPQAARSAGMTYNALIQSVLNVAIKRHNLC